MIIDKIENAELYISLDPNISAALKFLSENDLSGGPLETQTVIPEIVLGDIMEYETKSQSEGKHEAHYKHIDVQFMISGEEFIYVTTKKDHNPFKTDLENDYSLYECESQPIHLKQGMFAIFFPDDIHMPGIQVEQPLQVRKIVLKVKM